MSLWYDDGNSKTHMILEKYGMIINKSWSQRPLLSHK